MKTLKHGSRLIETDEFPFEFLSQLAERESWRKEIHRPIYHIHKWWAKRLGSVFRGILLGCMLPKEGNLETEFYRFHDFSDMKVLDPFMGSGTTIGEAHKLGFMALGRDINPVAVESVRVALGPMQQDKLEAAFHELSLGVGKKILALYQSEDSSGQSCDVLYYFWVMQSSCPACYNKLDLFSSFIIAENAYPSKRPDIKILCPSCGNILSGLYSQNVISCDICGKQFNPRNGTVKSAKLNCPHCHGEFPVLDAVKGNRPAFRIYAKLVLRSDGKKEYLPASAKDLEAYAECSRLLHNEISSGNIKLPTLKLEDGYNTRQAMNYGFHSWRDFFNDRQLIALGWLQAAITKLSEKTTRDALHILFSGTLEFNNMFASYKGEGTGAVRHMFAHHILKPERTPIEANIWGTTKSSGAFLNLFRSRLLRAIEYRSKPTEVNGKKGQAIVCSPVFTGSVRGWPKKETLLPRAICLSCGDSSDIGLPDRSIDLVITDPPFFDNVHYSELADFFYSWQLITLGKKCRTTRDQGEVQDTNAERFSSKLKSVFCECYRVLRDDGLLVFTYHHSRSEGWEAIANAVLGSGFIIVNAHPVKSEMSVATPKSQAKEPIQLDIILVCRKHRNSKKFKNPSIAQTLESSREKLRRLQNKGLNLSHNDRKIVFYGQLLTTLTASSELPQISKVVMREI